MKKHTGLFPFSKGKTSKQAHTNLPKVEGKTTYEEEHGRQGFFGNVSHLYHLNPPTGFTHIEGNLRPTLIDTKRLEPTDKSDSWGSPLTFLENNDVKLKISQRSEPMPFYYRNGEGDDIWFIHKGEGRFETTYGPLDFERGDYLVIPRGTMYRILPSSKDNHFLLIESKEEVTIPDKGLLGPNALFDPAMIETPEPQALIDEAPREWIVRVKRNEEYTDFTFPYNPLDVVGWKGNVTPWKINIKDFLPVMSHRYHLPPSVHSTFVSNNFVVCSFVPRPFETDANAVKIPFFHSNVEFDEVIFYHDGDFFSRDNIDTGMVTFHPMGITHGPHPKALKKMLKQDKQMTNEYAVMVDTKNPLRISEEAKKAIIPEYVKSWMSKE